MISVTSFWNYTHREMDITSREIIAIRLGLTVRRWEEDGVDNVTKRGGSRPA
jgi:hypothetical protein